MRRPYYKKVDRSMMDWGLTIPKEYINDFESKSKIPPGSRREIEIIWDKKKYQAKLCHVNILRRKRPLR